MLSIKVLCFHGITLGVKAVLISPSNTSETAPVTEGKFPGIPNQRQYAKTANVIASLKSAFKPSSEVEKNWNRIK